MGCASSTDASGADGYNDDKSFAQEADYTRSTFDKGSGEVKEVEEPVDKPAGDLFEAVEAGSGEQFMAVKPWIGAVIEPTNHNPPNPSPPSVQYTLDYVYGYRCEDSRQNVFFNANGNAVYMTAALGVILDKNSNTQVYFGGGQVDLKAKNISNDNDSHTDDITAISMTTDRTLAVTGQVGSSPVAFLWDAATGQKQQRFKLSKGGRGVDAIAISNDGTLVALVDRHDQHNVYVFDVASGAGSSKPGDTNRIFDIVFSQQPGNNNFVTAGSKHIKFWDSSTLESKKGLFGEGNEATSFACAAADDQGNTYTGGANSLIYVWAERSCTQTVKGHNSGFVSALRWVSGKLYSGGKDGQILIWDTSSMSNIGSVDFGGILIRAIDVIGEQALVGCRNGTIYQVNLATQEKTAIMESHSDGEVWGLAVIDSETILTSGDDNQIRAWSVSKRKAVSKAIVSNEARKLKRRGASTLSTFPDSQCSRAIAYCPQNGHVAVAHNDGTVTIRAGLANLDNVVATKNDSKEWIEDMEYSPDGAKLAVGSHDNKIYIYSTSDYSLIGQCTKHNSFIVSVDWSMDGQFIRSVCGAYELLFFNGETYQQDTNGASNTVGTTWATNNAKFGWLVDGIFPNGTDGSHINYVDFSKDGTLIATGDDYGLVNIWNNPARKSHRPVSLRGHSEHVVRVSFSPDDSYLFSIGGYDQTLMQWKRN